LKDIDFWLLTEVTGRRFFGNIVRMTNYKCEEYKFTIIHFTFSVVVYSS